MNKEEILKNQDAEEAYWYAIEFIQGRWLEAEPFIMQSASFSYHYALDVIEGRWPEAEPFIIQDAHWASWYAQDVLKKRWIEAERVIMKNKAEWKLYKEYFHEDFELEKLLNM